MELTVSSKKNHLDVSRAKSVKRKTDEPSIESGVSQSRAVRPKLHAYIRSICRMYARQLRQDYKDNKIRNAFVFDSAIPELARLGYIALVDGRIEIPSWLPEELVYTIKRVKYHPIWMPSPKLLRLDAWMFEILWPTMKDGKIVWHYSPERGQSDEDMDV
jgi:hypothetical protein